MGVTMRTEKPSFHLLPALRVGRGLSQEQLAAMMNRSQSWLSRVEAGRLIPSRQQTIDIARALEVEPETLLGEDCRV